MVRHASGVDPTWVSRRAFLGGLGAVSIAMLIACGGSASATPTTNPAAPVVQLTDDNRYSPSTLTVAKGTSVTFQNVSTMVHTATDDPAKAVNKSDAVLPEGAPAWDSGLLQPGQSWTHTFDAVGTYHYFCIPHETLGMLGTITVQ
jgi:plastocyanin